MKPTGSRRGFEPSSVLLVLVMLIVISISISIIFSTATVRAQAGIVIDNTTTSIEDLPAEYYVDANGLGGSCSDSNIGSMTEPFCTAKQAAIASAFVFAMTDKDITVYFREGTYHPNSGDYQGLYWGEYPDATISGSSNMLHVRAYPGENVVLDCGGAYTGLNIKASNVIVEGFDIINFRNHGITVHSTTTDGNDIRDVSILNNRIHDCSEDSYLCYGIRVSGGKGHAIKGNDIFNIVSHYGTYMHGNGVFFDGNEGVIEGNTIHDNMENGIMAGGSSNLIAGNTIFGHRQKDSSSGMLASGSHNNVHNNTLYDNKYNIHLQACTECSVMHNLIYSTFSGSGTLDAGNGLWMQDSPMADIFSNTIAFTDDFGIMADQTSHQLIMEKNVIYGGQQFAIAIEQDTSYTATNQFISDYNLFHSATGNPIQYGGMLFGDNAGHSFDQYQSESGQDAGSLFQEDPLFADEAGFDFRPAAESPLCDVPQPGEYIGALPCMETYVEPGPEPEPEPPCMPDWGCTGWSACDKGIQSRNCYDWNGCGDDTGKPYESQYCDEPDMPPEPEPPEAGDNTTTAEDNQTAATSNQTQATASAANQTTAITGNQTTTTSNQTQATAVQVNQTGAVATNGTAQANGTIPWAGDGQNQSGQTQMPSIPINKTGEEPVMIIEDHTEDGIAISTDQPAEVDIEKAEIGMKNIKIRVKHNVSRVAINVARISGTPIGAAPTETGIVYQYLNITHENVTDSDIDLITIRFDVKKEWIVGNLANASDIYLSRYTINQWVKLPTRMEGETDDAIHYTAMSPGLSMFSIMAGSVLSGSNRTCVPYDIRCVGSRKEQCDTSGAAWVLSEECDYGCSEVTGCLDSPSDGGGGDPWTVMIIIIVVILVLGILGFYFQSKREGLTQEIRDMQTRR